MSALVLGTIPACDVSLVQGEVHLDGGRLSVGDIELRAHQGTAALLCAARRAIQELEGRPLYAICAVDTGMGDGTRLIYREFERWLDEGKLETFGVTHIAFHYLSPVMSLMRKACETLAEQAPHIQLIGDAGGMYAARAAGVSSQFELLTPDIGEIGFLAEPEATHPAYVARYLFGQSDFNPVELIVKAHELGTASRVLVVKGSTDYVAARSIDGKSMETLAHIDGPDVPALEAIGGTGDTITGFALGLMASGFSTEQSAVYALHANRIAGKLCGATPATQVGELVNYFGSALKQARIIVESDWTDGKR